MFVFTGIVRIAICFTSAAMTEFSGIPAYTPLMVNKFVHKALRNYLEKVGPGDDDYLFASKKTGKPVTIHEVSWPYER